MLRLAFSLLLLVSFFLVPANSQEKGESRLRAGAYSLDITPVDFPCIVNGGFLEATAKSALDNLFARCLILEDGKERIVLLVVDSCMMPRDFLDGIKKLIQETHGIPPERVMISATHTHTAPSVMGALGSRADDKYRAFLGVQLVRAVGLALKTVRPARAGWAVIEDPAHTFCRRWIFRSDKMLTSPFGEVNVRANMHPGHLNPTTIGPSGPVDSGLSILSLQGTDGKPIAIFANYSMHYYGSGPVSSDYYGRFCNSLAKKISKDPGFVAVMSQGTSGDLMWMDYGSASPKRDIQAFADAVASEAFKAFQSIQYKDEVPLGMAETRLRLGRRTPDEKRLDWAKKLQEKITGPIPKNREEVYALEQIHLHEQPNVELKLQAIRLGDLAIATFPNEVFGITGLKIKERSPFKTTFNIELANGSEGYIPPPEQHALGGYTTWPARTAALDVQAEPKIVDALLLLLEQLKGEKRKPWYYEQASGQKEQSKLAAYRLEEMELSRAFDSSGNNHHGQYEKGVALWLTGPPGEFSPGRTNRAAHFAGGRMKFNLPGWNDTYTVEGWIWNGFPVKDRAVAGYFFSRGKDGEIGAPGDHLALGGKSMAEGKLLFFNGNTVKKVIAGETVLGFKTWHHVALVRQGKQVMLYLDGKKEAQGEAEITGNSQGGFLGGRSDGFAPFEGKLDEFAIYPMALDEDAIRKMASRGKKE